MTTIPALEEVGAEKQPQSTPPGLIRATRSQVRSLISDATEENVVAATTAGNVDPEMLLGDDEEADDMPHRRRSALMLKYLNREESASESDVDRARNAIDRDGRMAVVGVERYRNAKLVDAGGKSAFDPSKRIVLIYIRREPEENDGGDEILDEAATRFKYAAKVANEVMEAANVRATFESIDGNPVPLLTFEPLRLVHSWSDPNRQPPDTTACGVCKKPVINDKWEAHQQSKKHQAKLDRRVGGNEGGRGGGGNSRRGRGGRGSHQQGFRYSQNHHQNGGYGGMMMMPNHQQQMWMPVDNTMGGFMPVGDGMMPMMGMQQAPLPPPPPQQQGMQQQFAPLPQQQTQQPMGNAGAQMMTADAPSWGGQWMPPPQQQQPVQGQQQWMPPQGSDMQQQQPPMMVQQQQQPVFLPPQQRQQQQGAPVQSQQQPLMQQLQVQEPLMPQQPLMTAPPLQ